MNSEKRLEYDHNRLAWFDEQMREVIRKKRGRPARPLSPEEMEEYDGPFEIAGHRSTLETTELFYEVRAGFAYGLYISTSILCAAIIEQILSGELETMGIRGKGEDMTLGPLLSLAKEHNVLTNLELSRVESLKETRESFLHYRGWGDERSPLYRGLQKEGEEFDAQTVALEEAKEAIRTMLEIRHIIWTDRRQQDN